jgi:hypothetical protein
MLNGTNKTRIIIATRPGDHDLELRLRRCPGCVRRSTLGRSSVFEPLDGQLKTVARWVIWAPQEQRSQT